MILPYLFDTAVTGMKTCFKCNETKALSEFYAHPRCQMGTLNKCKDCTKLDVRKHHHKMMQVPQWVAKERERQRIKEAKRRAAGTAHKSNNATSVWRKLNPAKSRAHNRVAKALTAGRLNRQPCEVCGDKKSQAHHEDYQRPLDVRWLCSRHHSERHVELRLLELGVQ